MAGAYGKYDERVVDYQLYRLDPPILDPVTGAPLELRGPRPDSLDPGRYFVCIGAAQTFGRFCPKPFPSLLQERLGLGALNLGRGGAGPSFFGTHDPVLLGYINRARFAILQVMSGRSAGSSSFAGSGIGAYRRPDGTFITADEAFEQLLRDGSRGEVERIVSETRADYVRRFRELLRAIEVPKILFWFSVREPRYQDRYDSLQSLFRDFPQLVNEDMIRDLRSDCDGYASCVSSRGLPQRLVDRHTGEPVVVRDEWSEWKVNPYYPSPEMHRAAARVLERVVAPYLPEELRREAGPVRRFLARYRSRE